MYKVAHLQITIFFKKVILISYEPIFKWNTRYEWLHILS
jgi:hypothetical protein